MNGWRAVTPISSSCFIHLEEDAERVQGACSAVCALRTSSVQVRKPHFELRADLPEPWLAGSHFRTRFFDALSLLLPAGERFFIDAVRDWLPQVRDASNADARAFLGQEAWHSRVHLEYNLRLEAADQPALRLQELYERRFARARELSSKKLRLATTVGAEHITTLLAAWLLENPSALEGADPEYAALWRWHSAEELEHRDATATVYHAVAGSYWMRVAGMAIATVTVVGGVLLNLFVLLLRDGALLELRTWRDGLRLLLRDRLLASTLPRYWSFFRPRFRGLSMSMTEPDEVLTRLLCEGKLSLRSSAPTAFTTTSLR